MSILYLKFHGLQKILSITGQTAKNSAGPSWTFIMDRLVVDDVN
jgi:hypothetical protein